ANLAVWVNALITVLRCRAGRYEGHGRAPPAGPAHRWPRTRRPRRPARGRPRATTSRARRRRGRRAPGRGPAARRPLPRRCGSAVLSPRRGRTRESATGTRAAGRWGSSRRPARAARRARRGRPRRGRRPRPIRHRRRPVPTGRARGSRQRGSVRTGSRTACAAWSGRCPRPRRLRRATRTDLPRALRPPRRATMAGHEQSCSVQYMFVSFETIASCDAACDHEGMSLTDDAAKIAADIAELRHAIHREPEIGLDLPKTQHKILGALDGLPLEVSTGQGLSSVTAVLRGGKPGPAVLLRGDMDALPITEATGVDYASRHDGVMHACGHDLHVAMLAGAARLLSARKADIPGTVVFMFQPGEEGHAGARHMIDEGVLDAAGERVAAAYA